MQDFQPEVLRDCRAAIEAFLLASIDHALQSARPALLEAGRRFEAKNIQTARRQDTHIAAPNGLGMPIPSYGVELPSMSAPSKAS